MKVARAAALSEILRVAATCFGEMGYRATTLDTIAAKAGLSKVTLYRYVKSKDELLSLVFERTIESFRAGLGEIIEQRLPADEKLRRIVRWLGRDDLLDQVEQLRQFTAVAVGKVTAPKES